MSCETYREALSARIDGERGPLPEQQVDLHLTGCPACHRWYEQSLLLRRSMLVRAAPPVPDLTAAILENAPPPREKWGLRIALGTVALVQCGLAFAQLLGVDTGMHGAPGGFMQTHLINESAAWNLAVGIGLLWAALRTRAAAGQLPMIAGFVLVLTVVSAGDLLGDRVTPERLLSHGFLVVGLALLFAVHRRHRATHQPGPVVGDALDTGEDLRLTEHGSFGAAPGIRRSQEARRPAGKHRAA
ncbi:zf-HC2 domain-containing protein [Amycolatopsis sp. H20-H5]|uniref:zf-HC2 domain-containing protein n=1 Tax=Amycolatopsis sp. H20-H5 TaxID=3046309 RepID=UPI002DB67AE5|nr:zf-HC2 domain-containing protein [Amycolatopsis sp. H20-H5]MEC3979301.1 zf-HC2 domain-containing protein [Amycolatopsis sp. H20-H5]